MAVAVTTAVAEGREGVSMLPRNRRGEASKARPARREEGLINFIIITGVYVVVLKSVQESASSRLRGKEFVGGCPERKAEVPLMSKDSLQNGIASVGLAIFCGIRRTASVSPLVRLVCLEKTCYID